MATWQSRRHKTKHGARPQLSPEALARKRQRSDERRMALPAPVIPPEPKPGELLRVLELRDADGRSLGEVYLHAPAKLPRGRRSRCDSYEVRSPWGDVLVERGGLHQACRAAVAHVWPRQLPRDVIAALER